MKNKKRASTAGTVKGSKETEHPVKIALLYCITILLAIATVLSGWHIEGIWDGLATMIMGTVTVIMVEYLATEVEYGESK